MDRKSLAEIATCVFVALIVLAGCSQQAAPGDSSSDESPSDSISPSSSSVASSDDAVTFDGQSGARVFLDYNAGTGYEWTCSVNPEGVLEILSQETKGADENMAGGPLRDVVTLVASKPGAATLTCELQRPWESNAEPAETRTFAFIVDPDLRIALDANAKAT